MNTLKCAKLCKRGIGLWNTCKIVCIHGLIAEIFVQVLGTVFLAVRSVLQG